MTTTKRIGLSFGCLIAGACVMPLIACIFYPIRALIHPAYDVHRVVSAMLPSLWLILLNLIVALPAWVLILPFVICIKDAEGWRGWFIAVVGMLFGPLMMFVWPICLNGHFNRRGDAVGVAMAAYVSIPTTLFYVFALKRHATRS